MKVTYKACFSCFSCQSLRKISGLGASYSNYKIADSTPTPGNFNQDMIYYIFCSVQLLSNYGYFGDVQFQGCIQPKALLICINLTVAQAISGDFRGRLCDFHICGDVPGRWSSLQVGPRKTGEITPLVGVK